MTTFHMHMCICGAVLSGWSLGVGTMGIAMAGIILNLASLSMEKFAFPCAAL